ncbi:MAG: adenine phosphoribosyltransferase [Haliea sp.]|jgi:adenine phosphoribosyltransferase|nr:adenine phosphoribosyltransferase [Haliea sp.]MBK6741116.1 adenine phosphoribosyltransferase [Haliea sp.]
MPIKSRIRTVKDFPKKNIMFRDVTSLIADPVGLRLSVDDFVRHYAGTDFDLVVGIDSRGFIFGGALAYALGKGFVPIRKMGKLPAETVSESYELEYGTDTLEIHRDAVAPGQRVLIIDDLIATGGTGVAAVNLVRKLGGEVAGFAVVVNLPDIGGSRKLQQLGVNVYWQTEFEGD